jgi:hypothetical protein
VGKSRAPVEGFIATGRGKRIKKKKERRPYRVFYVQEMRLQNPHPSPTPEKMSFL